MYDQYENEVGKGEYCRLGEKTLGLGLLRGPGNKLNALHG